MFNNPRLADFDFDPKKDMLGKGKFGYVYKVKNIKDNQIYALKIVKEMENSEEQINSINREYHIMSNINHPNIEKCYGLFKEFYPIDNCICYFFILEFIKGENLTNFLERYKIMKQNIDQKLIIIILKGILNGLDYLHKQNIFHRDISTDNIMIENKRNNIKITDFGISAYFKQYHFQQNPLFSNQSLVGRTDYASPEIFLAYQNQERPVYGFKTDIYSLGITMFKLMTFCYPSCIKNRNLNIPYSDKIDSNKYDQSLINVIMNMLQDDQRKRPSCQEIYNSLEFVSTQINNKSKKEIINNIIGNESCLTCIMKCMSNIDQIYDYLIDNKRNRNNKKLNDKKFLVIKNFIEVLEIIKEKNSLNNDFINNFMNNISEKIIIFKDKDNLKPKTILQSLFNYFLFNLPKIYIYNNTKGYDLFEKRNQDNLDFFYINQKIEEYKEQYNNIFVNTFYFLVLNIYTCPECYSIIKQDLDIQFDIEFSNKDTIENLLDNYYEKKEIPNTGNNLICNNCDIMPKQLFQTKQIYMTPEIFIFHFDYFVILDETLKIKENNGNEKQYYLKAIIFSSQINNNKIRYEIAIKIKENWKYYSNEDSQILSFNDVIKMGNICMAFYSLSSNEFSLLG